VLKSRFFALCGAVAVVLTAVPVVVSAPAANAQQSTADQARQRQTAERPQEEQGRRRRGRAPAQPSAEEVLAAATAQAAIAAPGCQVTNARLLGKTAEETTLYEIACATGAGSIIETKTPPVANDCVVLAVSAQTVRSRDPEADAGPQCELPGNTDIQAIIAGYAKEAAIDCTVDQATVRGVDSEGLVIYEIGCQGVDGYWLKKAATGWDKTPCLQVVAESGTCTFTTTPEQSATIQAWLPETNASDCQVGQSRLMGQNANGKFYEVTCTGADGFILRVNEQNVVQQVYACSIAQQIGGGCTLTATAPAATTEETPPAT